MEDFGVINANQFLKTAMKLSNSDMKMLFVILSDMSSKNRYYIINNKEWRNYLSTVGINKSPERISIILSSLVKSGILKREGKGIYVLANKELIMPATLYSELNP